MNREFMELYNRELSLFYEHAEEFSEEYPGVAERLGSMLKDNPDPMIGGGVWRIMFQHVMPNVIAPVIIMGSLSLSGAILGASSLSFLGLGAQPPTAEWGLMLADGRPYLRQAWWLMVFPGAMITLFVLASNIFGDGLRDALDPRTATR